MHSVSLQLFGGAIYLTREPTASSCEAFWNSDGPAETGRIYIKKKKRCFCSNYFKYSYTLSVCVAALQVTVSQTVEAGAEWALSFMLTYFTICSWSICTVLSLSSNCPCRKRICLFKSANSIFELLLLASESLPPVAAACEFRPLKNPFLRLDWFSNGLWVSDWQ